MLAADRWPRCRTPAPESAHRRQQARAQSAPIMTAVAATMRGRRRLSRRVGAQMAAAVKQRRENRHVEPSGNRRAERDSHMAHGMHQREVDGDIDDHGDGGGDHRALGVVAAEESRRQRFVEHIGRQANGKRQQRRRHHLPVVGREGAACSNNTEVMGPASMAMLRAGRNRQQQARFRSLAVLVVQRGGFVAGLNVTHQHGQQGDADGRAEDARPATG